MESYSSLWSKGSPLQFTIFVFLQIFNEFQQLSFQLWITLWYLYHGLSYRSLRQDVSHSHSLKEGDPMTDWTTSVAQARCLLNHFSQNFTRKKIFSNRIVQQASQVVILSNSIHHFSLFQFWIIIQETSLALAHQELHLGLAWSSKNLQTMVKAKNQVEVTTI